MRQALLRSIQVGLPRQLEEQGDTPQRPWTTGFYKEPWVGPVRLRRTNLDGDGQADLVNHGGPDKVVCVYSGDHYEYWREVLAIPMLPPGAFGENFTVEQLAETDVCIGDTWAVGDSAIVQVSQPRQPCWKLARRWQVKTLALQVQQTGRTGWYFRVLTEGDVAAGMPLNLLERPHPQWTIERANQIMHHDPDNRSAAATLAATPLLSKSWQATLSRRAEQQR